MKIYHLSCGSFCPVALGRFLPPQGRIVCHCLLIETSAGWVLVDSGLGVGDLVRPLRLLGPFSKISGMVSDPRLAAVEQVIRLGVDPRDVKHIILTHMDFDHAGGVADFPLATVHVHRQEYEAARHPERTLIARSRYRAHQWNRHQQWNYYGSEHPQGGSTGTRWNDFEGVQTFVGLPPEILLVPLFGHTRGHCGVAVQHQGQWMLHAGDAYFFHDQMLAHPRAPLMFRAFERLIMTVPELHQKNVELLRDLAQRREHPVKIFCAHDEVEWAALGGVDLVG